VRIEEASSPARAPRAAIPELLGGQPFGGGHELADDVLHVDRVGALGVADPSHDRVRRSDRDGAIGDRRREDGADPVGARGQGADADERAGVADRDPRRLRDQLLRRPGAEPRGEPGEAQRPVGPSCDLSCDLGQQCLDAAPLRRQRALPREQCVVGERREGRRRRGELVHQIPPGAIARHERDQAIEDVFDSSRPRPDGIRRCAQAPDPAARRLDRALA